MATKKLKDDVTSANLINAIAQETEGLEGTPHVYNVGEMTAEGIKATPEIAQASYRAAGAFITSTPEHKNEFLSALYDRIGKVIYEGYAYENHLAQVEKGEFPFGWTIEDIFVKLVEVQDYTMNSNNYAEDVFDQKRPDVESAFYQINYRKKYKVTTYDNQLKQAFLDYNGVKNLVTRIIQRMYDSTSWDEELSTRYLLSRAILDSNVQAVNVPEVTPATGTQVTTIIKAISNEMKFMSSAYNRANVPTHTDVENQILFITSKYDAAYSVEVQAAAFNLDKVDYLARRILVRSFSFSTDELARLKKIFTLADGSLDPNFKELSEDELSQLESVPAMIVDKNFLQVYRNLEAYRTIEDPDKLSWNHWLHIWKILATSPFANAVAFTSKPVGVDSVTVTPQSLTVQKGQSGQLTAEVKVTGFAPKFVNWELTTVTTQSYVSQSGVVSVGVNETNSELRVKVTSIIDPTKYAYATVTVQS